MQLDSWWYPHRTVRPFDTDEWDVPPTGLERWEARDDILGDGIAALRAALGDPPLVAHCRHLSSDSPYVERHECWIDGEYAHPVGVELYETYLDQAAVWGVETFEHDWLVECFLGVRGLRERPGRATEWQRGLDAALARAWHDRAVVHGDTGRHDGARRRSPRSRRSVRRATTATWCPLSCCGPGSSTPTRSSGRSGCGPTRTSSGPTATAAAAATAPTPGPRRPSPRSRVDRSASATHSARPTGTWSSRPLRADGTTVAPDVPVAAIARCFARHGVLTSEPVVGATHSTHAAGRWSYVLTMNCHDGTDTSVAAVRTTIGLAELGADAPEGPSGRGPAAAVALDWRSGRVVRIADEGLEVTLDGDRLGAARARTAARRGAARAVGRRRPLRERRSPADLVGRGARRPGALSGRRGPGGGSPRRLERRRRSVRRAALGRRSRVARPTPRPPRPTRCSAGSASSSPSTCPPSRGGSSSISRCDAVDPAPPGYCGLRSFARVNQVHGFGPRM